ncbi:MAG: DUF4186 domain-containing protein [Betaproteobacteria bacterium]|nr:DUF4186 domain-containing protein [Betaproteobacteria bacterium]
MRDLDALFKALAQSAFRTKFRLSAKEKAYLQLKGMSLILDHAEDFVQERLAPAVIVNDGMQTPMRGHPVFVAQHATACCCRGCLQQWHHIPSGRKLSQSEQAYVVVVIERWLNRQMSLSA